MSGKTQARQFYRPRARYTRRSHVTNTTIQGLIYATAAAISVILVGMLAMSILEAKYRAADQHNQERISWSCNGNDPQFVSSCSLFSRA